MENRRGRVTDQVKSDQIRSGHIGSDRVRSGQCVNQVLLLLLVGTHSFASLLLADGDGAAVVVGLVDDVVALPVAGDGIHAHVDVALQADIAPASARRGSGPFPASVRTRGVFERLPAVLVQRLTLGLIATASTLTWRGDKRD